MEDRPRITVLLHRISQGDKYAEGELFAAVYEELRTLAGWFIRRERPGHTLQPTALVSEAYLRMLGKISQDWTDRAHFFRIAAKVMRHILVDHARQSQAAKRTGPEAANLEGIFSVSEDQIEVVLAVDTALKRLEERDPRQARIVELRFFGGLTEEEIALLVGASSRTVKRDWVVAKAWLKAELGSRPQPR